MGCQSSAIIGSDLVFSVCTHDPDTGILTDAATEPTYRLYENETATAILTGTMSKLDDANTTGFYTELIACTAANGFESGKSYTIYIEATVSGNMGGISYGFTATTLEEIADAILSRDIDNVETTAALHSLTTAILKAVSRIVDDAGVLKVYRTDGSTLHMSQTISVDATNEPIESLTVGS